MSPRTPSPALPRPALGPPDPGPGMLVRPRVTAALEAATERPSTVLSAPAGSGRTVALAAWSAATGSPWAWLTLEAAHDDPRRFRAGLSAALRRTRPGAVDGAPVVLVLDDVHLVRSPATLRHLRTLLTTPPAGVHVVASGRTSPLAEPTGDPGAGASVRLGAGDLAFTEDEAAALLDGVLGLRLGAASTAAARRRTGGWAAGLALVAAATPRDPGREGFAEALATVDAEVAALVAERVLGPADPGRRALLTRAAILEHPTAARCDAVLGADAAGLPVEAGALGLLVRDAGGRDAWRPPFGAALRRLLDLEAPDLAAELHARASVAAEAQRDPDAAIAHAAAAGDPVRAASLTDAHVVALGARPTTGRRPAPAVSEPGSGPPSAAPCPWRGRPGVAVDRGRRALRGLTDPTTTVHATTTAVLGQALWLAGDVQGARALLEPVVGEVVHPAPRSWSLAVLALAVAPEEPARARRLARQARRIAGRAGATWLEGVLAHQALSDALRRTGDLEGARDALTRAASRTAGTAGTTHHALTLLLTAELALAEGERRVAAGAAGDARALLEDPDVAPQVRARLRVVEDVLAMRGAPDPIGRRTVAGPAGD